MPYDTVAELPEQVRHALPKHAQEIWRAAYEAAWEAHSELARADREATCARIAWGAVKRQYETGPKGGMWRKKATEKAGTTETQRAQRTAGKGEAGGRQRQGRKTWCFVNDLAKYPVQIIQVADQTFARGLPLMRPGTWNGNAYTADDMRQIAQNFALVRDAEGFEPALKPQHSFLVDGTPIPTPANLVQGWSEKVWFDEGEQVLFGDVRLCDEWSALQDMKSGKLRYLSTEIQSGYELSDPATGEVGQDIGQVLVGIAWVDNPAVKGLGWELVVNAAEYGNGINAKTQRRRERPSQKGPLEGPNAKHPAPGERATRTMSANTRTQSAQEGGSKMEWLKRLKALLMKAGVAEEDLEDLGEPETVVAVEGLAAKPDDSELVKLRAEHAAQLAERDKRIGDLEAKFATAAVNARRDKVTALVDMRVRGATLAPAQREATIALAMALPEEAKVKVFAADGKTETEVAALDAYFATLDAQAPKVSTHGRGLAWAGNEDPNAEAEMTEEQITAIADQAREPKAAAG
jgi:cation transport regulator